MNELMDRDVDGTNDNEFDIPFETVLNYTVPRESEVLYFNRPLFKKELDKVFSGERKAICLTGPWESNPSAKTVVFLEKFKIKVKEFTIDTNRYGGKYIKFTRVYILSLFPALSILRYYQVGPKTGGAGFGNDTYQRDKWDKLVPIDILSRYLKYYDYKYIDDPYPNIVPMCGTWAQTPAHEPLKKVWRNNTFREVLKAYKLPLKRSLIRTLATRVLEAQGGSKGRPGYKELPALTGAKYMWKLTNNLELTQYALENNSELEIKGSNMFDTHKSILESNINKKLKLDIGRLIANGSRLFILADTFNMKAKLEKHYDREFTITHTSIDKLHDYYSKELDKITNASYHERLEWDYKYNRINGLEMSILIGKRTFKFVLPHNADVLREWARGSNLCCCIAVYRDDLVTNRVRVIGVYEHGKLFYAITINSESQAIMQFKARKNYFSRLEDYLAIFDKLLELGIVKSTDPHFEDPRKHIYSQGRHVESELFMPEEKEIPEGGDVIIDVNDEVVVVAPVAVQVPAQVAPVVVQDGFYGPGPGAPSELDNNVPF